MSKSAEKSRNPEKTEDERARERQSVAVQETAGATENQGPGPQPGEPTITGDEIEKEIVDKGLTAARITPGTIDAEIRSVHYAQGYAGITGDKGEVFPSQSVIALNCLTICVIVMRNGFTVVGKSACASPENFDAELGRKIAFKDAREQIWPLAGYALKERLTNGGA